MKVCQVSAEEKERNKEIETMKVNDYNEGARNLNGIRREVKNGGW